MKILTAVIIFPFITLSIVFGQEPHHIRFNTANGLPSNEVYAVHEDKYGYLWFTTDRGIAKYDGYSFSIFTTKDGLTNNTNFWITEDVNGGLYFLALDGTANYYQQGNFKCVHKLPRPEDPECKHAQNIYTDSSENIYLYYIQYTNDGFFYKTNIASGVAKRIPITKEKFKIWLKESDGKIMTSSDGRINLQTVYINGSYITFPHSKADELYIINNELTHVSRVKTPFNIAAIYKDGNDLWVCTMTGLFRYKNADLKSKPEHYFKNEFITQMTKDRENIYWLTTLQNGVIEVMDFNIRMMRIDSDDAGNRIQRIAPHGNEMAFGIQNGKVWLWDSLLKASCILDKSVYIKNLIWESDNKLLGNNFILTKHYPSNTWSYGNGGGQLLSVLSNGDIVWGYTGGINITRNGDFFFSAENAGLQYSLYCAFEDRRKTVWIGTDKGVWSSPIDHYSLKKLNTVKELKDLRINTIQAYPHSSQLTIGTMGKGVAIFNPATNQCRFITQADGLISDLVHCILFLNDSVMLAGTNMGLSRITMNHSKEPGNVQNVENFTVSDGLISNYINDMALWRGMLWIATDRGFSFFEPSLALLNKNDLPPVVYIDSLTTSNGSYKSSGQPVELTYKSNDLSISFTGLCKRRPAASPFYRYSISSPDEKDKTWISTNNRSISFSSLSPGSYIFEVQARNKNNVWSKPAQVAFIIHPHFTQTLWFRLCLVIIIGLLIGVVINRRIKFLKQRQKEIQLLQKAELQVKTAELNVLRNQMNPHFLYNALNSIQNFIFKKEFLLANDYLGSFARLIRNTLHQSKVGWVSLREEVDFLKNYLFLEKMRFGERFNYEITVDDMLDDNIFLPALLAQPLLENAVKHAFENTSSGGLISVRFEYCNEYVIRVKVRDNGIGIKYASKKSTGSSMGIKIVQDRIELLDKEYPIARVSLSVTDVSVLNINETGTIAEMMLPVLNTPPK